MKRRSTQDHVDHILEQWHRQRPDLDVSPMGIIGRISRAERLIDSRMKAVSLPFQLERWGFDVLATLRRAGEPYHLTPTQLFQSLMLTSGAITNRIDRLEEAGWVERLLDPSDRRVVLVSLTRSGLRLIDRAVAAHMEAEEDMLAPFSTQDREKLVALLRTLVLRLEADDTR
ncbi:MAG TPA: MarR family transcriptional regulator [Edaphobacter sp.]|nr:MarR family transcriptional regulator [Edaphobacter sp.]